LSAKSPTAGAELLDFRSITYAGGRFFALAVPEAYTSLDASNWQRLNLGEAFLPNAATSGNSVFLIAGNGGLALSSDARQWQRAEIDCALESACRGNPSGEEHDILDTAWFSEGRFYVNRLRSPDGIDWEEMGDAPIPFARWGEYEVGWDAAGVAVWKPGSAPVPLDLQSLPADAPDPGVLAALPLGLSYPPPPDTASFPLDTGEDCTTSACIVVNGRLYLAQQ
jgi:hypothetical protein